MRALISSTASVILLLVGAVPVMAESLSAQDRNEIGQLRASRGFAVDEVNQLIELVNKAGEKGIPTEPLANKVKEGLAKGVEPKRIDPVLRQLVGHFESAQETLREAGVRGISEGNRQRAMETMADALARGATVEEIRELTKLSQDGKQKVTQESLAAGAKGLAVMKEGKISSKDGAALVGEGLRQGYKPTELLDLGREIKRRGPEFSESRIQVLREQISRGERSDRLFREDRGGSGSGDRGDRSGSSDRGERVRDDRSGGGDRGDRGGGGDRSGRDDRGGRGGRDR